MKIKVIVYIAIIVTLGLLTLLMTPTAVGQATPSQIAPQTLTAPLLEMATTTLKPIAPIATVPPKKVALHPALYDVCSCESNGKKGLKPRQFEKDGSVVTGKINKLDKGACQINLKYHRADSLKMGLDVLTEAGNFTYANYLYKTQGLQPWSASSACWGSGTGTSSVMK